MDGCSSQASTSSSGYQRGHWQNGGGGRGYRGRGGNWRGQGGGWRGQRGGGWRGGGRGGNWRGRGHGNSARGTGRGGSHPSSSRHIEANRVLDMMSPYKGWRMYFMGEAYNDDSPTVAKVKAFEEYFLPKLPDCNKDEIESKGCVVVDYKELITEEAVCQAVPSLRTDLRDMPENIIKCLGLAQHQVLTQCMEQEAMLLQQQSAKDQEGVDVPSFGVQMPLINARIVNFEPVTPLKNLKANYYGKFVSIRGTVVRVSNIKPMCTKMAFQCNTCGDIQVVTLPDGRYILPTKCLAPDCKGRSFAPKQTSPLTETVDWQTIKVQEIMTDGLREAGRIPRTVECELTLDLVDSCVPGDIVTVSHFVCPIPVDSCVPGDIVTVCGIVKVSNIDEGRGRNNKDKCMFLLYVHANSVQNLKRGKESSREEREDGASSEVAMDFTIKELYAIQEIQAQKNLFQLIVGSLCPAIYGHELVKAGLILGLFGGSHKFVNDKNRIPVRGDPHILVVGDPGLGKSQMLQAASNIAPRGVYVCGNTTTTSGLTVTLSKDGSSGDYSLEAGALVLGDQGCCCIDEFDKMGNQHSALLEAMEQQSISLAKAGIVCSLPARTSILAAANPIGGHYNKAKTVSENLKMGSALLSRFDLVFILLDKPDEEMDFMLSEHVMKLHTNRKGMSGASVSRNQEADNDDPNRSIWDSDKPLSERLKVGRGEAFDPIPPQLLRKYIAYARKYVHPSLTKDAATVLQTFYLELRKQHQGLDSTPITTRQLESLIRLTEARARLELREDCTQQDAEDVVELMKFSMVDTYSDEFGILDFQRSQHGSGMSSRSQAKRFIAILNQVAERTYNSIFTVQQMRDIARDGGIQVPDFEGFIASLNNQSYLLKKGPRVFQLQTASF